MKYYICKLCGIKCYGNKITKTVTNIVDKIKTVIETVTIYSFFNGFIKITKDIPVQKKYQVEVKSKIDTCIYCKTNVSNPVAKEYLSGTEEHEYVEFTSKMMNKIKDEMKALDELTWIKPN